MRDRQFWTTVASLGPELAAGRLALALGAVSTARLGEFWAELCEVQEALETVVHHTHGDGAVETARDHGRPRSWWTPELERPAVFADLKLTVVAHGRDAWAAVVAAPTLLSGNWPTGLGRQFLATVTDAQTEHAAG